MRRLFKKLLNLSNQNNNIDDSLAYISDVVEVGIIIDGIITGGSIYVKVISHDPKYFNKIKDIVDTLDHCTICDSYSVSDISKRYYYVLKKEEFKFTGSFYDISDVIYSVLINEFKKVLDNDYIDSIVIQIESYDKKNGKLYYSDDNIKYTVENQGVFND